MLEIICSGAFEGGIKKLLSAVRLVDKTRRILPIVHKADWMFVNTISKMRTRSVEK